MRTYNQIIVTPLNSNEACQTIASFGASDGALYPGVSLRPNLSVLPLQWTLRITRDFDAFDIIDFQMRDNDPRITRK